MMKTVIQMARSAGVSARTLHYYDEIGLLNPDSFGRNGYRYYGDRSVLRLQQILFYRELGLPLDQIRTVLDQPDFDPLMALEKHRTELIGRKDRLNTLIKTIDQTIRHLKGEVNLGDDDYFTGFSEEQQREYSQEARQLYGTEIVDESERRWSSYSAAEKETIFKRGKEITLAIRDAMPAGYDSPVVQEKIDQWRKYIDVFYDCTLEIFRGLGQMYNNDPRFKAFYAKIDPALPAFLEKAMLYYCDQREKA
jgi:DNA-binding transcriptional MerR regulator